MAATYLKTLATGTRKALDAAAAREVRFNETRAIGRVSNEALNGLHANRVREVLSHPLYEPWPGPEPDVNVKILEWLSEHPARRLTIRIMRVLRAIEEQLGHGKRVRGRPWRKREAVDRTPEVLRNLPIKPPRRAPEEDI